MADKNRWEEYNEAELNELDALCGEYKTFLNNGKTERECVKIIKSMALEAGFKELKGFADLKKGDKFFIEKMGKTIALFVMGKKPVEEGINIVGAHVDSPRLDLKQNPIYETDGLCYADTHYYGGIKKYQWLETPLALHGVVVKKDGTSVDICIGEDVDDPVVVISDLLVHLSQKQMSGKANEIIEGEKLDIILGNRPAVSDDEDGKEQLKKNVLNILAEKYDFEEDDFMSAEIEAVPAGKARDCGIDRSMIMSYGQDDRVCAFASLKGILEIDEPERTACCLFVDKEEIGSVGATGMHSHFFENVVAEIVALSAGESELKVRRALENSSMLSADVTAAYDPMFAFAFDKKSAAQFTGGLALCKYTGSRGKSGSNDANAEFIAKLRNTFDDNNAKFQFAELGRVDVGGGGTIAYIMANYGMEVIDAGVPLLGMHAPYEISSKVDVYESYKGYKAFMNEMI